MIKIDFVPAILAACLLQGVAVGMTAESCLNVELFSISGDSTVYLCFEHGDFNAYISRIGLDGSIGEICENN